MTRAVLPVPVTTLLVVAAVLVLRCSAQESEQPAVAVDQRAVEAQEASQEETTSMTTPASTAQHTEPKHTNRLIDETSPYLLQHAHNPVDWHPWGEEALEKAREEGKPIFLSIGYSACHWCHVMERESFENEEIAKILNEHFVSIKVDREERPDLDDIYMTAVQLMTGHGGWPMSVFLTPDLKPFFGGTYFPPDDRPGYPVGFKGLLTRVADAWENRRDELIDQADRVATGMERYLTGQTSADQAVSPDLINGAVQQLKSAFDPYEGGFGDAPKFPPSAALQLLLRAYADSGDEKVLEMTTVTLDKMALGGMYDHLGGGFHRYSTDAQWLVPHFEKMLYDNAQLTEVYLEAWQLTKKPLYLQVAKETMNYVLRDMTGEAGGFYSAEDADSEGQEGKFYVWTHDEIMEALGSEDGELFARYYNVKPDGNFRSPEEYHEGKNILHMEKLHEELAKELDQDPEQLRNKIDVLRDTLRKVREKRVRPGLDDKTLTSWNGLMIDALAKGYAVTQDDRYRTAAVAGATFVREQMMQDGQLLRTHRKGDSRLPAYLDDYAFTVVAFTDLYEVTFNEEWLFAAGDLADSMIVQFWDDTDGVFYFTGDAHKNLLVRTKPTYDGAEPSGNSMAALGLLQLAKLLDKPDYHAKAEEVLKSNAANMTEVPRGYVKMLVAVDFLVHPPKEIAIAGSEQSDNTNAFVTALYGHFVPNKVVALLDPEADNVETLEARIPLLAGKRPVDGKPAAYVCKNFACERPVTEVELFVKQLDITPGEDDT